MQTRLQHYFVGMLKLYALVILCLCLILPINTIAMAADANKPVPIPNVQKIQVPAVNTPTKPVPVPEPMPIANTTNPAPIVPAPTPMAANAGNNNNSSTRQIASTTANPNFNEREQAIRQKVARSRNRHSSVMWTADESKRINAALKAFQSGTPYERNEEFAEEVEETQEEEVILYTVYLASLIYINDHNWSIWLNNKKISNDEHSTTDEFQIIKITDEYVTIKWQISALKWDLILAQANITPDNNQNATPGNPNMADNNQNAAANTTAAADTAVPDAAKPIEDLSRMQQNVVKVFTLRPNQTYIPVEDSVVEGKVNRVNIRY